ncbi:uncharacterized protein [Aristolochia californica]|uniref:uncharacterized protein n=1 Tax=Aristolochia californica TaxID=171875 RepID=UPI0035D9E536
MAMIIHWYDLVCFAIVAVAILGSSWVVRGREGPGRRRTGTKNESLLLALLDGETAVEEAGRVACRQLWMSCWRWMDPLWLLGLRGVAAVVMAVLLACDIGRYDATIFVYYTEWTFALVILYFVLGVGISAHGCWMFSRHHIDPEEEGPFLNSDLEDSTPSIPFTRNKVNGNIKLPSQGEQEEKERVAGFGGYLMQILYQTCAGAVVLTDIVFWFMIVPFLTNEHFKLNMLMGCMHTLNAVFLVIDTAVNSLPFPLFRSAYFVLWSCIYVIFQWILHACGFTWWPYPFLELATPWAPAWYLCLALIHIPCYGLYSLIVKAKHLFFPKLFPNAYIQSC